MAVTSLRYRPDKGYTDDHKGVIVYDGKPSEFFDWEFRINLKIEILKTESDAGKRVKIINQITDGLRGDALQTAQDLGVAVLIAEDGIEQLAVSYTHLTLPTKRIV